MPGGDGQRVARVAVEAQSDRPERTFSYLLPDRLGLPAVGSLLLVPYGPRLALGYLLEVASLLLSPAAPESNLRPVEAVVSPPLLTPDLLVLAEEVASYYRSPVGTTIAAMLPPGLESRLERRWEILDHAALPDGLPPEGLAPDAHGTVDDRSLRRRLGTAGREARLQSLRRSGAIRAAWILREPELGSRLERTVRRLPGSAAPARRAPQQAAILAVLGSEEVGLTHLAEQLGRAPHVVLPVLRRLEHRGMVALGWREAPRDPLAHRPEPPGAGHRLADEQQRAVAAIGGLPPGGELLLEGVAASGKTDVYLAAIRAAGEAGRRALLLVPEVSLVPQLVDRVLAAGLGPVAVLHSGLSPGERHDEWWRILRGEARLVIGTRMATFAPVRGLGLVVLDEAHDGGYKSDRTPRYDARWVARRRAAITGARLVLATATPSLTDIARFRGGLTERVRLVERRVGAPPAVEVVDMRAELAAGNRSIFSDALERRLASVEDSGGQAILLINRRGAATFVLCRDCGEPIRCPDCELPLVYHLAGDELRCHHCGRSTLLPEKCPACGRRRIRQFGAGTQRVEAEVRSRFPRLRVGRLDSDALAARRRFEAVYDDFRDGRLDVLVGTQLAAKGLDLPTVRLAGVVAADVTLNLPDYFAPERTFQLLAQIAGRAGRGPDAGHVVIQTYAPAHYAVRAAARLDVDGFADEELLRRRLLGYPPYSVLARLLVADPDRARAEARGRSAAEAASVPGVEVLGPLPAYVPRRAGRWRVQVVLRSRDPETRAAALERLPAGVAIDVDPESLL